MALLQERSLPAPIFFYLSENGLSNAAISLLSPYSLTSSPISSGPSFLQKKREHNRGEPLNPAKNKDRRKKPSGQSFNVRSASFSLNPKQRLA
jgi:hypothetical protein